MIIFGMLRTHLGLMAVRVNNGSRDLRHVSERREMQQAGRTGSSVLTGSFSRSHHLNPYYRRWFKVEDD